MGDIITIKSLKCKSQWWTLDYWQQDLPKVQIMGEGEARSILFCCPSLTPDCYITGDNQYNFTFGGGWGEGSFFSDVQVWPCRLLFYRRLSVQSGMVISMTLHRVKNGFSIWVQAHRAIWGTLLFTLPEQEGKSTWLKTMQLQDIYMYTATIYNTCSLNMIYAATIYIYMQL